MPSSLPGAVDPEAATAPSPGHWYCVQTKPRSEIRALEHLERQQFECLLPRIRRPARASRTHRLSSVIEPLFPRYLFVHADPSRQSLAPIRSTCGVIGLVRFANQPARVPDQIIERLCLDGGPDGVIEPAPITFRPGDAVRIIEGPFHGLSAIYTQPSGEQRALVLLTLLGSERRVQVPAAALQPLAG